jgi:hypothetical protein
MTETSCLRTRKLFKDAGDTKELVQIRLRLGTLPGIYPHLQEHLRHLRNRHLLVEQQFRLVFLEVRS